MPKSHRQRRQGFFGQHHIVLPPVVVEAARENTLLRGLLPTDAGLYPAALGHHVVRQGGAAGHVLIICLKGAGWVRYRGDLRRVEAGGVLWLPPGVAHAYGAGDGAPWTIEWVHLTGGEAAAWRAAAVGAAADEVLWEVSPAAVGEVGLWRVYEMLEQGYDEAQLLRAAAALRVCLAELVRLRRLPGHAPTALEAVDASAAWMRERLARPVTLAALARRAGLSPSHFTTVFRQRFGFAPIDWLIRARVREACRLLDATSDKVEVVGRAVGWDDPCYFARIFGRVMGCSPRAYRGITKG